MVRSPFLVLSLSLAVAAGLLTPPAADAQRRRRRTPPAPTEATAEDESPDAAPGEPEPEEAPPGDSAREDAEAEPAAEAPTEAPAVDESLAFGPDLGALRGDFTTIMDELVQLRSRTAVLGRQLFNTRFRIRVENRAADDNNLERIVLTLDGAPVFQGGAGDVSEDAQQVFDGFAAPGPHVLGVEVEQRQRADAEFRYTLRDTYRFPIERDQATEVTIILEDDSDMGEDFEDDGEGEFDVRTRLRVATREVRGGAGE